MPDRTPPRGIADERRCRCEGDLYQAIIVIFEQPAELRKLSVHP
jgi:hypothetical protein